MRQQIRSYMVLFITLLTLCAFTMPVFCSFAHAHADNGTASLHHTAQNVAAKTATHHGHNKTAAHGECCAGHHCCLAKLFLAAETRIFAIRHPAAVLTVETNQSVSSVDADSFDRPPKHLV